MVKRQLAEGGMAEIYLASVQGPEGFEKDVVIKRIRSFLSTDPEFVQMFIAEAKLAARLNHANIVQIFDFGQHEDAFYIAMEYVRGRSLWDVRKRCRERMVAIPATVVAQVGLDVARGLHYAHHLKERGKLVGLVHRDVTPHNVLLAWEGAVKLTDFGIAKAGNKLTTPGMLKGKFAYMSPEQARGDDVDARTDVFALGIVLWEMLTGGRLFEGDSDVAVLRAVQQSNIAPPGRLNPDIHPDLDAVVMRALERDVERRYQTAQELERALGQFILGHAKSIDDTDLGGFLDRLYADERLEDGRDRTTTGFRAPLFDQPPSVPPKREPTAVMPSASGQKAVQPPSWDEDAHAATYVVPRGERAEPQPRRISDTSVPASRTGAEPARGGMVAPESQIEAEPSGAAGTGTAGTGSAESSAPRPRAPQPREATAASVRPTIPAQLPALGHAPARPEAPAPAPALSPKPAPAEPPVLNARAGKGRRLGVIAGVTALAAMGVTVAVVTQRGSAEQGSEADAGALAAVAPAPVPAEPAQLPTRAAEVDGGGAQAAIDAGALPVETAAATARTAEPDDAGARAPDEAPARTAAAEKPPRHAPAPEERPHPHVGSGTLIIRATPFATVYIAGEKMGDVTGQGEFKLAPGKYVVKLEHPRRTLEKVVTIRDGARQRLTFELLKR